MLSWTTKNPTTICATNDDFMALIQSNGASRICQRFWQSFVYLAESAATSKWLLLVNRPVTSLGDWGGRSCLSGQNFSNYWMSNSFKLCTTHFAVSIQADISTKTNNTCTWSYARVVPFRAPHIFLYWRTSLFLYLAGRASGLWASLPILLFEKQRTRRTEPDILRFSAMQLKKKASQYQSYCGTWKAEVWNSLVMKISLMMKIDNSYCRNVCNMSLVSFSLAVIFITCLLSSKISTREQNTFLELLNQNKISSGNRAPTHFPYFFNTFSLLNEKNHDHRLSSFIQNCHH